MRKDLYQSITEQIIEQLEKGVRPWHRPWSAPGASVLPLRHNGIAYRGVNILALWMAALAKGYRSPIWMTFRQALALGGCVRKGEKGSLTVFASTLHRPETEEGGEETLAAIHYLKAYTVFNVEQIDGLPQHYYAKPEPALAPQARIARAEAFFAAAGACLHHGGSSAYYLPADDRIQMPAFEAFENPESYYATLAHEITHWTGHPSRLNRAFGEKHAADEAYAREELVAELGAAFLCAALDLAPVERLDHASYLDHWLRVLKADKRAIFAAAAHAQRAADFLQAPQPEAEIAA
jgi:antirestriction protein ArdC